MKTSNKNQTVSSVSPVDYCRSLCRSRWLMVVMAVQLAIFLLGAPSATAALVNPDLKTTEGITEALADGDVMNLGPTGLIGWLGHNLDDTSESRQILITSVDGSSPASGKLAVDDVILGVSGDGTTPVKFTSDARMAFALAIAEAEARATPELKVKRWRSGTTTTKTLTLQNLGAYTATAPWNCAKSTAILEAAVQYTYDNEDSGKYSTNALALMAVRDLSLAGTSSNDRKNRAEDWAKEAILSNEDITFLMNNEVESGDSGSLTWSYGHKLIVLSEYYLQTGDSSVYPTIEALARGISNGMSVWGAMGHRFTQPNKIDGSLNGIYQWGYGTVNSAGLPCFLGLTLAKECGVNDSRVDAGIAAASQTFAGYANVGGTIPYGEHAARMFESDNNGKNSIAALALSRVTGYADQANTFGYMATSAASQFGKGHTGSWFAKFWQPLAANLVGAAAAQTHFNDIKWRLDLARRHDGGFAFNDIYQGNKNANADWHGFLANTHAILTYAMPYGKLAITDNTYNSANHLTASEVSAAALANTYDASTRSNAELLTDLDHDIIAVGYAAAEEMGTRTADHAYFLTELHAKVPNVAESENGRMMACFALGQIGANGGDSDTSAALLAALLEDGSMRIRWGATYGMRYLPNSARLPFLTEIVNAIVNTEKPVFPMDTEDPMQLVHGELAYLLFGDGGSSGPEGVLRRDNMYTQSIDPALYRPAIQAAGRTAMGRARSTLQKIYPELNQEDFEFLCPDIIETIENQPPLDRMFGGNSRFGGLETLQDRNIAEGVGLAKFVHWDLNMPGREVNRFSRTLETLADYAGSSELVSPDQGIEAYAQSIVNNSASANEVIVAQSILDAIAADSNPTPLTSLKSLSVTADDTTLVSPALWTTLHVVGDDLALKGDPVVTWSKKSGPGRVTFSVDDSSSGVFDMVVFTDGTPGTYTIECKISDTRGYAETGNNASFANGYSEVTETIDITVTSAQAEVIYQHSFGGSDGVNLFGTGVDVDNNGGSNTWSGTNGVFEANGDVSGSGGVWLPFAPTTGNIYQLSGVIDYESGDWITLGFAEGNPDANFNTLAANPYGTTLVAASITTFDGEGLNGANGHTAVSGFNDVDIVLDATDASSANWTVAFYLEGALVSGPSTITDSGTFPGVGDLGDIQYVGFSSSGATTGAIDDFALTIIPAPSTAAPIVYSFEKFGGAASGIPALGSIAGTDYDNTTTATNNGVQVVANLGGGPTGQHMELRKAAGRHISTQDGLLTLATDNMISIDVSFSVRFDNEATTNLILEYSASGLFDDTELIVTLDPLAGDVPNLDAGIWYNLATTILATDVTFTDTAKLRWQTSKDKKAYLDDIIIIGTPGGTTPPTPVMVTVPYIVGLAQATAESNVTAATLTVGNISTEYSPTVPAGDVISQGLSAGASVAEGSAVDLVVSLGIDPSPKLVRTTVNSVSNSSWTTVNLGQTYNSAVIIATPIYSTADTTALVTRITNVTSTGFDLKVDRADGLTTPITIDVSVVAVDEGVYTQAVDGVTMEAVKFTSTVTAGKFNWVADARTYQNSYTNPVVVGQVMSINDADWSVFWSMGSSRTNPADASNLNVGKHIGEDTNTTRADETIGYIVIEEGSGSISGVAYEAALGGDTVRGFDDSISPYTYTLSGSLSSASSAAASISGMDGNSGAWAVLSGNPALTTTSIGLYACEDQIVDSEQGHANTQVGYIVFE